MRFVRFVSLVSRVSLLCPLVALGGTTFACAGAAPSPVTPVAPATQTAPQATGETPTVPPPTGPTAPAVPDVFSVPQSLREEADPVEENKPVDLAAVQAAQKLKGVAPAPQLCASYTKKSATAKARVCPSGQSALLAELGKALGSAAPKRDAELQVLEACGYPPGFVRALRAELAPTECGDVLVDPLLKEGVKGAPSPIVHALVGYSLAARLHRTTYGAPTLKGPFPKDKVAAFFKNTLSPWMVTQAKTIEELARIGSGLQGYGMGLVAIEAGSADLRLVEIARESPIPDEFKGDAELSQTYLQALDQTLQPRTQRGRDGALVGLRKFADVGVLRSERLARARKLVAGQYGGRRIDALDDLLLPPFAVVGDGEQDLATLATALPPFFAGGTFTPEVAKRPGLVGVALAQGFPWVMRAASARDPKAVLAQARLAQLYGRTRLGLTYWRGADFDRVVALAGQDPTEPTHRFYLALGLALRQGPSDAVDMMARPSPHALNVQHTEALEALAREKGSFAGLAAFDAARLRELAPPPQAGAEFFKDLASRYRTAAELLLPGDRDKALAHAKAADDIAIKAR
jgi:hypothetical protein